MKVLLLSTSSHLPVPPPTAPISNSVFPVSVSGLTVLHITGWRGGVTPA